MREEKIRWIRQFEEKYGSENLIRLEGARLSFRSLLDEIAVAPFIAPKRLIVVEGVMKASKEEIQAIPVNLHPQNILLFVDPKPDKRLSGTKELLNIADIKEFKPLTGLSLRQWMQKTLHTLGASITPDAEAALLDMTGEDQELLQQELQKLALAAAGKPIARTLVEEMVSPTDEGIVWKLSDLLAAGKKQEAILYAHRILERGGDAYGLWAIMLNMLKNTVAVFAEISAGNTDQKEISQRTGLHFMAVRSIVGYVRTLKKPQLQSMLEWAVETDKALKTGSFRSTDEAPEELHSLIDQFLLKYP